MARGIRIFLLIASTTSALCLPTGGRAAGEEQVVEPRLERRDITVPRIDTEDFELGAFVGMMSVEDFGVNPVYGARAAYHITTGLFAEAAYGTTETGTTSYERLSGGARLLDDSERRLSYYNVSFGYNLLPGETFLGSRLTFTSDFYAIAGIGSTDFAGNDRFTINFGAGYRLLATDWLALHLDVRDHVFEIDVLGESKRTHNIELGTGLTVFF